jgi:hypothetical protein
VKIASELIARALLGPFGASSPRHLKTVRRKSLPEFARERVPGCGPAGGRAPAASPARPVLKAHRSRETGMRSYGDTRLRASA